MWTTRILVMGSLLIGAALPTQAAGDGADKTQASQVSADDMAQMRQLRPGQSIFQTREGCGVLSRDSRSPSAIAFFSRSSWEGTCADGLALGPGRLILRNDNMETYVIHEGWQYYGHYLGHIVSTRHESGEKTETFQWNGGIYLPGSAFAQQHAADVVAVKQAIEPTLTRLKRETELAVAEKQREAERQRAEVEAAAQRQRDEAARAEQRFRASLQTMNPGQLFAKADELNTQGDSIRAREVQRALMSRFPNHSLAATAARQMAGESGGSPTGGTGSSAAGTASGASSSAPLKPSAFSKENSRYSSICMRNAAKAEQALTAANARRYFGGSVDLDIFDMAKRIAQPCMAYDAKAKWSYDDAEQARVISQCRSGVCPRWKEGTEGEKTRQWFEIFSGEFNKMMANWEGYSRDLDPPGSSSPPAGAAAQRSAAGRVSSQQCEAMRQRVVATKVPSNASVTASTETVMFMTQMSLDMIDGGCPGTTTQDRQEHQQAHLAAERACNQVQSGGRRCVARNHFGPGAAPEAGIRSPYPNIPVGSVPKITRLP